MALAMVLAVVAPACAELDAEPSGKAIGLACTNDGLAQTINLMGWDLRVEPTGTLTRGDPFNAVLSGTVVLSEELMEAVQDLFDLEEVNVVDIAATVQVRSGATGDDQRLILASTMPYQCFEDRSVACNPDNDDEQVGELGRRPNSDCQPESELNPCGRFVSVPKSEDCLEGGECERLLKGTACELYGYCITGDLRVDLDPVLAPYAVESEAPRVLFGWDDEHTGAIKVTDEQGKEVWRLPPAMFDDATPGPNSVRVDFLPGLEVTRTSTVAFECTMGTDPDSEGSTSGSASPSLDDELIAIPIQ